MGQWKHIKFHVFCKRGVKSFIPLLNLKLKEFYNKTFIKEYKVIKNFKCSILLILLLNKIGNKVYCAF